MKRAVSNLILSIASLFFTAWGIYLLITGDLTNGLLAIIVGELIDIPKSRLKVKNGVTKLRGELEMP